MVWMKFFPTVSTKRQQKAPHPIPEGMEGAICPITGLSDSGELTREVASKVAREVLETDPDILAERLGSRDEEAHLVSFKPAREKFLPLQVSNSAHRSNQETRRLVRDIGGLQTLRRFTNLFYTKSFADPHLDRFIADHHHPHGERFASWIAEKFGDGTPWSNERRTRPETTLVIGRQVYAVSHDRSSAHVAAWNSPKREAHKRGDHFKPEDARVWMRLHFWAAREAGLFENELFIDYYMRFIGHFISVYSSKSPPFTRESARWSANPENIRRYVSSGNNMVDVIGVPVETALATLPANERVYTGSKHHQLSWPYELR